MEVVPEPAKPEPAKPEPGFSKLEKDMLDKKIMDEFIANFSEIRSKIIKITSDKSKKPKKAKNS